MDILCRDHILAAKDLPQEIVPVPEWGGDVIVRGLTGFERDAYETQMLDANHEVCNKGLQNVRAKLAVLTIIDESGESVFKPEDAEELGNKSASALNRIFPVAQRLSGITDADMAELEGNSGTDPDGDSGSN